MPAAARLRIFYFLYYGAVGANLPYFAAYLRGLGFSGSQIGIVHMLAPAVAAPAALAWAIAADRLRSPVRALRVATAFAFVAMAFLPFVRRPVPVAAVLLVSALFTSAVVPLVDSVTVEWLRAQPGRSYARIRLFGSLGFVAVAMALGFVLDARGDRPADVAVPVTVAACVAAYALVARRLPSSTPAHVAPALREMAALLRNRRLLALLAACAIHWGACAPFHLMFGLFVRDSGMPSRVTGLAMFVAIGAEIVALLAFPRLERTLGVGAMLAASFGGTALRWLALSRAADPVSVVALQLVHGLTFGVFWAASVAALSRLVPAPLRATGQALFAAVVFGAGNAAGFWLSGVGYDVLGGTRPLYFAAGVVESLLLVVTVVALAISARIARKGCAY
jgi:PPP family 3-phenylpropionic acid transporter